MNRNLRPWERDAKFWSGFSKPSRVGSPAGKASWRWWDLSQDLSMGGVWVGGGDKRVFLAGRSTAQREAPSYCMWDSKEKSLRNACYQVLLYFKVSTSPTVVQSPIFPTVKEAELRVRQGISLEKRK